MIQTVILAGGLGTRLRPLTNDLPKPLLRVRGRPFLHHQLELLKSLGLTDILLLVGYLGRKIEEHFGDGSEFGLHIDYGREERPLGTGGALKNAENKLDANFLLLNGDTLLPMDYRPLVECYRERGRWALVVAYENPEGKIPNNLGLEPGGRVTACRELHPTALTHVNAGVAVFSKRTLELIPSSAVCSLEHEIFPRMIERGELWAFPTRQRFYDMGSFAGLGALAEALA